MHVTIDRELSSDILCSHQISRRRMNSILHTRCIHKRRLRNDTSEHSSVEESVRSKKRKITNNTNHYEKSNTRKNTVARSFKMLFELKRLIK